MTGGRDDALSWDGDDDPTLDVGAARPAPQRPAPGAAPAAAVRRSGDPGRVERDDTVTAPKERASLGNGALLALGVLAGAYLLYTVGWVIGGLRLQGSAQYLVADVMFQGSLWLAILAPALWFATVLLLTRRSRHWLRFAWLAVGVALLVPWPFIMVGAVGQ